MSWYGVGGGSTANGGGYVIFGGGKVRTWLADKLSSLRAEKNESCLHVRPECWFQPFQVLATPVERSWS